MTSYPAAVIFDLDGCLVDSEPLVIGAVAKLMTDMGISDATFEDICSEFLGVKIPDICKAYAKRAGKPYPQDFEARVEALVFEIYDNDLPKVRGVDDMLMALKAKGTPVAIATGGSLKRMHKTLSVSGLDKFFEGTSFSAEQVAHGKPSPDLFLFAAKKLGVDPKDCVVLEDSAHGIRGAVAAGMRAIGFVGGAHLTGRRDAHGARLRADGAQTISYDMTQVTHALSNACVAS